MSRPEFPPRSATATTALGSNPVVRSVVFAALLAASFGLVWFVGHRGVFLLDQSIVFDGAWRIAQGQVPYRDFFIPFGPVTFGLQAAMFRLAGVSFSTMVLTAALLSVVATGAASRLLWRLSQRSLGITAAGGLLTAIWFQAPFGIPWMEQTAFLLDLLALLAIVEARLNRRAPEAMLALAGVAIAGAVLSKQNAGGLFLPVCVGAIAIPWRRRAVEIVRGLVAFAAGVAAGAAAFVAWLVTYSDVRTFHHYWFDVASHTGLSRIVGDYWRVLGAFFFQPMTSGTMPLLLVSSTAGAVGLTVALASRSRATTPPEIALASWLALALPEFQSIFQLTTNNDAANGNPYIGICVGCTLALVTRALGGSLLVGWSDGANAWSASPPARAVRLAFWIPFGVLAGYSVVEGLIVDVWRTVQEFAPDVRFAGALDVQGASDVVWGEPTHTTPRFCESLGEMCKISTTNADIERPLEILHKEDFERLARTLKGIGENFFVFPDATMLYGLAGRPSPQPILYFHPGQSFLVEDEPALDAEIVDSLVKHDVRVVVLERAAFMGTQKLLPSFPRLEAWINENFVPMDDFGNYRLLRARSNPAQATAGASAVAGDH